MGRFYERLVGIRKMSLRKSIGKLSLASSRLQIVLSEVAAIANTSPLVYVENELKPQKIVTPMHFLSRNLKVVLPATANNHEDNPDYSINSFLAEVHII